MKKKKKKKVECSDVVELLCDSSGRTSTQRGVIYEQVDRRCTVEDKFPDLRSLHLQSHERPVKPTPTALIKRTTQVVSPGTCPGGSGRKWAEGVLCVCEHTCGLSDFRTLSLKKHFLFGRGQDRNDLPLKYFEKEEKASCHCVVSGGEQNKNEVC